MTPTSCTPRSTIGDIDVITLRCVARRAPELGWFRLIRITSGVPSDCASAKNASHEGWCQRM